MVKTKNQPTKKTTTLNQVLDENVSDNKLKNTLLDLALSSILVATSANDRPKEVPEMGYPQVMGVDGKPIAADSLISHYEKQLAQQLPPTESSLKLLEDGGNLSGVGLNGLNQFTFNKVNKLLIDNIFLGYAEYSYLSQNGILNSICQTPADDMTGEWIEFVSVGDEDKTDRIKELTDEFERLDVAGNFNRAAFFTFSQGGCLLYPYLESNDKEGEMLHELQIDSAKISKGSFKYLKVIEPIWYVPIRYVTDNPFSKWFYVPEYYAVMGKMIHASRICKFIHNEAPNILKSQYNFNGMPVLQQSMKYVMHFETISNTVVEIIERLNLLVLKTGLQAITAGTMPKDPNLNSNAGQMLGTRLKGLNATRNNMGTMVIDFDTEELFNLQMSLQTIDKLWSQAAEFMCIVPKIPATEFLGISPQGFNSNGDYERKKYNKHIKTLQNKIFRPHLIKIMHMAMLNIWGEIDNDIKFNFKEITTPNELEQSTINLNKSNEAGAYLDRGVVDREDVRKKIASDKHSGWNELEIEESADENDETEYYPDTENLSGWNFGKKVNTPVSKP